MFLRQHLFPTPPPLQCPALRLFPIPPPTLRRIFSKNSQPPRTNCACTCSQGLVCIPSRIAPPHTADTAFVAPGPLHTQWSGHATVVHHAASAKSVPYC